jgi:diguanylate cyclase (GGDEF)-like protein
VAVQEATTEVDTLGLTLVSSQSAKKITASEAKLQSHASLFAWLRLQRLLAEKIGLAIGTLNCNNSVIGRIENDNSICQAMMASPEHARLCAMDCGRAHNRATARAGPTEFRCHAGLHCFALPVEIGNLQATVLAGKAFTSVSDYKQFLKRYSHLKAVESGDCLRNIKFAARHELEQASELVHSTILYQLQSSRTADVSAEQVPDEMFNVFLETLENSDQLEAKIRSIGQLHQLLSEMADTLDSKTVYEYMLTKLGEIMRARRSSLMIFNEQLSELVLEAAVGFDVESVGSHRMKLGEPIAGAVLESGSPMVVCDVDKDLLVPPPRRSHYQTKSFISFPIQLGSRKVGVINFTGRIDGKVFDRDDLSLIELMAPQLALLIDRTEWCKKAETYQQMSLTDALTGLPNRRFLEKRLFEEVERSKRHDTPLSFMIIDVDRFKDYNDLYGHTNADLVLVKTAQILRSQTRTIDMSARFAGDEFCIILPETDLVAAKLIAERLRGEVDRAEYVSDQGEPMEKVTVSIGISSFSNSRSTPLAILEAADRALYQAKTRGRNQVVVYDEAAMSEPGSSESDKGAVGNTYRQGTGND